MKGISQGVRFLNKREPNSLEHGIARNDSAVKIGSSD